MNSLRVAVFAFVLVFLSAVMFAHTGPAAAGEGPLFAPSLPIMIERNVGQVPGDVKFVARTREHTLWLRHDEFIFDLPVADTPRPSMKFVGANPDVILSGLDARPIPVNYIIGDARTLRTEAYRQIEYREIYPGVTLRLYGNAAGQLEYDLELAPEVDPSTLKLELTGFSKLVTDDGGNLVMSTRSGDIVQRAPFVYQIVAGTKRRVGARYKIFDDRFVAFEVEEFDRALALVIDPVIEFATYFGGSRRDRHMQVALAPDGDVWIAGTTQSLDLSFDRAEDESLYADLNGPSDAFLARFDAAGSTLLSATYFGGSRVDEAGGLAVAKDGEVLLVGTTRSADLPTADAIQTSSAGRQDMFLARFTPSGDELVFGTYFGGDRDDVATGVAVDSDGNAILVGHTRSRDFRVFPENALGYVGDVDAVSVKVTSEGELTFSVVLGGRRSDQAFDVAVGEDGDPVVTGSTRSSDFPTISARQETFGGQRDAFITKLDGESGTLVFSTFHGGTRDDYASALALDAEGGLAIVGSSNSNRDFPLQAPIQDTIRGNGTDAFLSKLAADGSELTFSTFLGGSLRDQAFDVNVDTRGRTHIVGESRSWRDFPFVDPLQEPSRTSLDSFVATLNGNSSALSFSTFLGGRRDDAVVGVAASGNEIYVVGITRSDSNFPLVNPFQPDRAGDLDGFLAKLAFDAAAPELQFVSPAEDEAIEGPVTYEIRFDTNPADLDFDSFTLISNGVDVTAFTDVTESGASYTQTLPSGSGQAQASIANIDGEIATVTVNFIVGGGSFRAIPDCAPTQGVAPLNVRFRSRAEFSGGSIVRYRWDFEGDGTFDTSDSVAQDYSRTFTVPGIVNAVLEVTNNFALTTTDSCAIAISGNPPTATADASPSNGPVPLDVNFSCQGTDPDGSITLYEWDFEGDGEFDYSNADSGSVQHTYSAEGAFVASCRVTDNDGQTAQARTTTTVIRPAPPGSPSVTASATPAVGNGPLTVNVNGSADDDGTIVLWEWDFDGDGTFEFSSADSPVTSFQYVDGGVFAATLRATDDEGKTGVDAIEIVVGVNVTLAAVDDTLAVDPSNPDATAIVRTSLSTGLSVRILMKDRLGEIVRVLVDTRRAGGSYDDAWDGKDDDGEVLPQGVYYAVLEYQFGGDTRELDLTNTTGGARFTPPRTSIPRRFAPFGGEPLEITYTLQQAVEVTAFIGRFNVDTRLVTLLERIPQGAGSHTVRWNGENADGQLIHPPSGDSFLFGQFAFTLSDNAIFLQSGSEVTALTAAPTIYDPTQIVNDAGALARSALSFTLSNVADAELSVEDAETGVRVATRTYPGQNAGANTISWDGRDENGILVAPGRYRLGVSAIDSTGFGSIRLFVLQRIFY